MTEQEHTNGAVAVVETDQELLDRLGMQTGELAKLIAEDYQRSTGRDDDWTRSPAAAKSVKGDFTDWMNLISSGIRPVIYALDEFLDFADLTEGRETLILSLLELARKQLRARGSNSTLVLKGMAVELQMLTEMHTAVAGGGVVDVADFSHEERYGELAYMAPWFDSAEGLARRTAVIQGEMRRIIARVDRAKRNGAFWDSAPLLKVLDKPDGERNLGGITHLLPYFAVAYIDRVKASAPGRALGHIQAVLAHQLEIQTQQTMSAVGAKVAGRQGQQAFLEALS